jgi:PAS domain S-box-containing protein
MEKKTPGAGRSVLIVDNDKLAVKVLVNILVNQGFETTCAYSGLDALQQLADNTFDLVFLDLVMPRVGGDRICRYITQSPRHADTKVFIVSAAALEGRHNIAELKPFACIAKAPYNILKKNILAALDELNTGPHETMLMFSEGVYPRSVVEELLFSQRHFETILSSMTEAVFELDINGTITYVNNSARMLLDKEEWELIGQNFSREFSDMNSAQIDKTLLSILYSGGPGAAGLSVRRQNRELSLSLRSVLRDNELIGATVVVNDLTEKKLLDQERCLRERLTGVIEMASAAAHEVNQPLTVISGHAQLLLKKSTGNNELQRHARMIYDQIERLGRLTGQFSGIASYKTKQYGENLKIIDVERSSRPNSL